MQVTLYFLQRDDIKAADDLGYVVDAGQVAAGAVIGRRFPDSGQVTETTNVSGGDVEVPLELSGWDAGIQIFLKSGKTFRNG